MALFCGVSISSLDICDLRAGWRYFSSQCVSSLCGCERGLWLGSVRLIVRSGLCYKSRSLDKMAAPRRAWYEPSFEMGLWRPRDHPDLSNPEAVKGYGGAARAPRNNR